MTAPDTTHAATTNFNSGESYLFIQGKEGHPMWNRVRLVTVATRITVDHICASAAIPLIFQPVRLKIARRSAFFGDGCVRLQQPLSPVIRLGAEKVFAIGVRCENLEHHKERTDERHPSLAQVMGVLFNLMFLDHLATDIEHLERLNQRLSNGHIIHPGIEGFEEMRPLTSLLMTPSVDLSQLAEQHQRHTLSYPVLCKQFGTRCGLVCGSDELLTVRLQVHPCSH